MAVITTNQYVNLHIESMGEPSRPAIPSAVVATTLQGSSSVAQVCTFQVGVAELAGNYDWNMFCISSALNVHNFYVWFDVGSENKDPRIGDKQGIKVSMTATETINDIATKIAAAINANVNFSAVAATDTVTITNANNGYADDITNGPNETFDYQATISATVNLKNIIGYVIQRRDSGITMVQSRIPISCIVNINDPDIIWMY